MSTRDLPPRTVAIEYLWAAEERLAAAEARVAEFEAGIRAIAAEYKATPSDGFDLRHNARRAVALRFLALVGDETPGTGEGA